MSFILGNKEKCAKIYISEKDFKGVKRVAGWLASDIESVIGKKPLVIDIKEEDSENNLLKVLGENDSDCKIIVSTLGKGGAAEKTAEELNLDISEITGKREVYGIFLRDNKLIVIGSDKRGSIYGILKISETIGVTPFIYYGDVVPKTYKEVFFSEENMREEKNDSLYTCIETISHEPSVRYRGFFINDEWPAFGNWSQKHFGDVNAKCYEVVFEYLLRMKGNYLWPAMWNSCFSSDGPGTLSAELADELGVVMGTSHHEPCMRAGEEFVRLNKVHTEYGKDWSFVTNREGITKFWEDGLERGKDFENVITVGMRGERDSKLFEDAKLIDNINVLKDVINCQKELIDRIVKRGDNSKEIPTMLAIYKEVEQYYKGDAETPGLKEWDGLDGITLMLCDDNFGNLRLLPDPDKRDHKGGYGMYYHFDYHGSPISYEWVNSSYLPKVWEQMTMAYDAGIRDIWIVNVGDVKFEELPLSYFLDLAYDFDKYGSSNPGNYEDYLKKWTGAQFSGLDEKSVDDIIEITEGYMRLNNIVKPETQNENTFSLSGFGEADRLFEIADSLEKKADELMKSIPAQFSNAYVSLIYFQAKASFNIFKLMISAAKNRLYAMQGRNSANIYADLMKECIEKDKSLVDMFHSFNNEKWYSMAKSKHIGFRNWNDEGSRMPVISYVQPIPGNEMIVNDDDSNVYSVGGDWCRRRIRLNGFEYKNEGSFSICNCGENPLNYEIICDDESVIFEKKNVISETESVADRDILSGSTKYDVHYLVKVKEDASEGIHEFTVKSNAGRVNLFFNVASKTQKQDSNVLTLDRYLSVNADCFKELVSAGMFEMKTISSFGKLLPGEKAAALKTYPQEDTPGALGTEIMNGKNFSDEELINNLDTVPCAVYEINAAEAGDYDMTVFTAPSNPSYVASRMKMAVKVNDSVQILSGVDDSFEGGESSCRSWCIAVLTQIRKTNCKISLKEGINKISLYALEPQVVFEKFVISKDGIKLPDTNLGPVNE